MLTTKELFNLYQMLLKANFHALQNGDPPREMVEGKDAANIVFSYLERSWWFVN